MKTLIAYYSRTNTTKKVAEKLAKVLKADTEEINPVKDYSGVIGYLKAGREAMKKIPAEIKKADKKASDYDLVIIGTPVWAWNVSSPVRAYLLKQKGIKKTAFFATQGGNGSDKAFSEMERLCKKKPIATISFLTKEVVKGNIDKKLRDFQAKLKKA